MESWKMDNMDFEGFAANPKEFHRMLSDVQSKIQKLVTVAVPGVEFYEPYQAKSWKSNEPIDNELKTRQEKINAEADVILKKEILKSVEKYEDLLKNELAFENFKDATIDDVVKKQCCSKCTKCPDQEANPSLISNEKLAAVEKKVVMSLQKDAEQLDKMAIYNHIQNVVNYVRIFMKNLHINYEGNPRFSSAKDLKDHAEWTMLLDRINRYEFEIFRRMRDFVHEHIHELLGLRSRILKNLPILIKPKSDNNYDHIYQ